MAPACLACWMAPLEKLSMSNNPMGGAPTSSERLEATISDRGVSAHASIMREVARLELDNQHLKKQNLRVWSAAGSLSLVLLLGTGSVFWWFPKYRFIPQMRWARATPTTTSTTARPSIGSPVSGTRSTAARAT